MENNNDNSNIPSNQNSTKKQKISKKIWIISSLILVILIITGTSLYLISINNRKNNTSQQAYSAKSEIDKLKENKSNSSKSSQSVQELATTRVRELTGLDFEEYKEIVQKNGTNLNLESANQTIALSPNVAPSNRFSNIENAKLLSSTVGEAGKKTFSESENYLNYNEVETTINQDIENNEQYEYNNVDPSKKFVTKNWSNLNFSQNIFEQDGKMVSASISTPSFNTIYQGGKYAVKINFEQQYYLGGFTNNLNELTFLAYLIEKDPNLKSIGKVNKDGKDYMLYEYNYTFSPLMPVEGNSVQAVKDVIEDQTKTVTRYYTLIDNPNVAIIENISNDKLVSTVKYNTSKILSGLDVRKALDGNIFKDENITVKEINEKDIANESKLSKAISKNYIPLFPDYITKDSLLDTDKYQFLPFYNNTDGVIYKLLNSNDFYGTFAKKSADRQKQEMTNYDSYALNYTIYSNDTISNSSFNLNIYDQEPKFVGIYDNYSTESSQRVNPNETKLSVNIDGNTVNCIRSNYNPNAISEYDQFADCLFKYKDKFYYISGSNISNLINLKTLPNNDLIEAEEYRGEFDSFRIQFEYPSLSDIKNENILYPGSLKDKLKLSFGSITKYKSNKQADAVLSFTKNKKEALESFVFTKNGYELRYNNYTTSADSSDLTSTSSINYGTQISFIYFDGLLEGNLAELKKYLQTNPNASFSTLSLNNKTYNTLVYKASYGLENIYLFTETKGKTVLIEISQLLSKNDEIKTLNDIVIESDVNKDINKLIEESESPNFGGL
jgi:hypothetical protein